MKKNNKSTIILIVIIAFLMLAIGICIGMLVSKDNTIINNYEQEQGKNETENVIANNKNEQGTENNDGNNEEFFGTKMMNIEDVSVAEMELSYKESKTITSYINKDGKSVTIKVEKILNSEGNSEEGYRLYLNDELFFDSNSTTLGGGFRYLSKIYIVDLDSSDEYYDLVLWGDYASSDYGYNIFKYNGTTFIPVVDADNRLIELFGDALYIDKSGILVPQDYIFVNANPVVSNIYYSYKENKKYSVSADRFKDNLIEFKNVYFTTDLNNINKLMQNWNDGSVDDLINQYNIYRYNTVKAYIIDNIENTTQIKVMLDDGTVGYLFTGEGNFAG